MRCACLLPIVVTLTLGCSSGNSNGAGLAIEPESPEDSAPVAPAPTPETQPVKSNRRLVRSQPLPELAAKLIRKQMQRHGRRMEELQWAALMLDYSQTNELAEAITSEPRISRPVGDDDTLNQAIPGRFFDLQDELHTHAESLLKASSAKDDEEMSRAFAGLSKTCINCHSLYLKMPAKQ